MADLKYWPKDLMPLLAVMRGILGVFHLVAELEKGIFNVVEAIWWRLAIASRSDRRHEGCGVPVAEWVLRKSYYPNLQYGVKYG